MEENTTPTQTPAPERKDNKPSGPGFTDHVQEGWRKFHTAVGTGGVIAVILAIIMLAMIASYDDRIDGLERQIDRQGGYGTTHRFLPPIDREWEENIQSSWEAMEHRMDELEDRHRNMMKESMKNVVPLPEENTLDQPVMPGSNGQYSGYRVIDGQTVNYSLRSRNGTLTGALIGTDAEGMKSYADKLSDLGLTVTSKNGQVQFTGPADELEKVIRIMNSN